MSHFYHRYVPRKDNPSASPPRSATRDSPLKHPRDSGQHDDESAGRKRRKPGNALQIAESFSISSKHLNHAKGDNVSESGVPEQYPSQARTNSALKGRQKEDGRDTETMPMTDHAKYKDDETKNGQGAEVADSNDATSSKHAKVLSKFHRSRQVLDEAESKNEAQLQDADSGNFSSDLYGLEPLPVPDQPVVLRALPSSSSLPEWQSQPVRADASQNRTFESMGLSEQLLTCLKNNRFSSPFPVQSIVIPLLLKQTHRDHRDVCVAAATGSGKTLAYIIPIIEDLRKKTFVSGLQAVIVVPTRELVRQVRETCEQLVSGTKLKIATAVGSKTLKTEQRKLVETSEIYDPVQYQQLQGSPVDWNKFDLRNTLETLQNRDPLRYRGFITKQQVKPNILITTPGRLVEHLKTTNGFNLDDVEWLVVDEADRLLNESYQEWIEIVVPALQVRNATREQDKILAHMRMDLPPRNVKKVLLSATMTEDISKLNSLGLQNPQLVRLESLQAATDPQPDELMRVEDHSMYRLPHLLQETAVTVKEEAEKPLVLLKLLESMSGKFSLLSNSQGNGDTSMADVSSTKDDSESSSASDSESSNTSADGMSNGESSVSDGMIDEVKPLAHANLAKIRQRFLVFTRSTASASRLHRLLKLLRPSLSIATLTRSTKSSAESKRTLTAFRNGKISILVTTDRASRGLDVPGLEQVISYDVPNSASTYVHRVGRTARAEHEGEAWCLIVHREGRWFWNEIGGKGDRKISRSQKIKKLQIMIDDDFLKDRYEVALRKLGDEVREG